MGLRALLIDALASEKGVKRLSRDTIGAGPRFIAGVLEEKGIECDLMLAEDFLRYDSIDESYDLYLVSAMTVDLPAVRKISKKLPEGATRILGGPVTGDPEGVISKTNFDILVVGEGERTLEELIERGFEPSEDVRGICYKEDGEIIFTGLRPILSKEEYNRYRPSTRIVKSYPNYWACKIYVEVVRGCSNFLRPRIRLKDGRECINCGLCESEDLEKRYYCPAGINPGCGFCSIPSVFGPPRSRYVDSVVEEVREILELGGRRIVLSAPDFLDYHREDLVHPKPLTNPCSPPPNYEKIEELLSKLREIAEEFDDVVISVENVKACLFDERSARIIGRYLPNTTIHIGVETGCPPHSRKIGKPYLPIAAIRAIRLARRNRLRPIAYFIHGLPGQSVKVAEKTVEAIEECIKAGAEKITLYRFKPLPMSAFANEEPGKPADKDEASRMIREAARRANERLKRKWLGRKVRVAVVRSIDGRRIIGYILNDGPVVFLRNGEEYVGRIATARITAVRSERVVEGEIIE